MRPRKSYVAIIFLCSLLHLVSVGKTAADTTIIDPSPYDLFYIDSSIIVNDGYSYATDSLAVVAILKANGWGLPAADSIYAYMLRIKVDSISTKVNGRIVKLNLDKVPFFLQWAAYGVRTNPPTVLPADIGKLTALQCLDLEGNGFDSLPSEIGALSHLICLWSDMNHLTRLPSTIGNLKNLMGLSLIANQLTELPPTMGNLTKLYSLALRDNNLSQLPNGIGNFINLVDLSLSRNHIQTLPPEIGNCKKLDYLEMGAAGLVRLPNEIGACTNLTILMVGRNNISTLPDSIVNLANCGIFIDSNLLCSSIPCPVQNWLDLHAVDNWRKDQHCSMISMPPCNSNGVTSKVNRMISSQQQLRKALVYDIRGRLIGVSQNGRLPGKFRAGIYILKSTALSGNKLKLGVVR